MKEQLKLEHLQGYLAYGLNLYGASDVWTINMLTANGKCTIWNGLHNQLLSIDELAQDFDLILHPLSDLTKEIKHNGERFVPLERLYDLNGSEGEKWFFEWVDKKRKIICDIHVMFPQESYRIWNTFHINQLSFKQAQQLHEWHFDIHGLIEKGLAVDINELKL